MPQFEAKWFKCDTLDCVSYALAALVPHPTSPKHRVPRFFDGPPDLPTDWLGVKQPDGSISWHCPTCIAKSKAAPALTPEQAKIAALEAQLAQMRAGSVPPVVALTAQPGPLSIPADPSQLAANQGTVPTPQSGTAPVFAGQVQGRSPGLPPSEGPRPPILAQHQASAPQVTPQGGDLLPLIVGSAPGNVPNVAPLHPITEAARAQPMLEPQPVPPEVQAAFAQIRKPQ